MSLFTGECIVEDGRALRGLAKRGLIKEPEEMFRPYPCQWGRDYRYVEQAEGPHALDAYVWKAVTTGGRIDRLQLRYFDGCFFPLVVKRLNK